MAHKSPAFQFYPSEFLSDENVVLMSNQEIGCYLKLICYCWREGSIPADINKIAKLCAEDGKTMALLWPAIENCFAVAMADTSRLIHPRLEIEREKQKDYSKEKSRAGKKGAKARWGAGSGGMAPAMAQPSNNDASAIADPMANDSSLSLSSSLSSNNKKNIKKKILKNDNFGELPDWVPKAEWEDYLAMRREKRKPATPRSQRALLRKLEVLRGHGLNPAKVLTNSLEHGWTGLFEYSEAEQRKEARSVVPFFKPAEPVKRGDPKLAAEYLQKILKRGGSNEAAT